MSEHFNIVAWLGKRPMSRDKRNFLEFAFRDFGSILGVPSEILILDTRDRTENQQSWDIYSGLLERALSPDELLFVYGNLDPTGAGDRASVCVDESPSKSSITISLPKQNIVKRLLEVAEICRRLCSELLAQSFRPVVLAGWEAELPPRAKSGREIVKEAFTQTPPIDWLAIPTAASFTAPGFRQAVVEDGVSVFRRETTVAGH
jgi:hypothetical protein